MPYSDKHRQLQAEWLRKRKKQWMESSGPCRHCGSWERLELDHIDPATKTSHNIWSWKKDRMDTELAKCQPLCHLCHKKKTNAFNSRPISHGSAGYGRGCRCTVCSDRHILRMRKYHETHPRRKFAGVAQVAVAVAS